MKPKINQSKMNRYYNLFKIRIKYILSYKINISNNTRIYMRLSNRITLMKIKKLKKLLVKYIMNKDL